MCREAELHQDVCSSSVALLELSLSSRSKFFSQGQPQTGITTSGADVFLTAVIPPSLPPSPASSMSTASPTPDPAGSPPAPDVELLFGPFLIGLLLNTTLYGVMLVQMLMYFTRYKRDPRWFRWLAIYLLVAETANVVFDIGLVYEPLIFRYGTLRVLTISPLMLRPDAAVTVAISTPIQLFIAWRVKVLTQKSLIPALISILAIASLAGGISVTVNVSLHPEYADFPNFNPYVITWLSTTAACDVCLSAALIYSLYTRKTGVGPTDRYVDRIIRLTVQTGSITAVTALLDLLVFLLKPNTTLNFIWDFPLSKLYTNALLSTLNARPWHEESPRDTMNVLFEQTPVIESTGESFSTSSASGLPLELRRRRQERPTFYVASSDTPQDIDVEHTGGMDAEDAKFGAL
ncbi:hypothetical protein FB45DRAFT_911243 [Roridomyces roridus]|uniref:DUF6534 domain-containing protein n=1 Tax=Roridomyces roridus TaxID=1738132 RepID=A0AAD7C091_9AGAR|nr:hypothetical protein FB45DRAFT_911243 [Roridomyces roridus]